ncbi:hypothetical protein y223_00025 [Bordetella phage PY223]
MTPAEQHARAIRHWARYDYGLRGQELRAAADFIEQQAAKPRHDAEREGLWRQYDAAVSVGDADAATTALRALLRLADKEQS